MIAWNDRQLILNLKYYSADSADIWLKIVILFFPIILNDRYIIAFNTSYLSKKSLSGLAII